jgi:hypothetical protein
MNRAVEGVLKLMAGGARRWRELLVMCMRGRSKMEFDAHDVKSECNMKIAPFYRVLWLVEGGTSCMKIGLFEEYFGCWLERGEGAYLFVLIVTFMRGKKGWTSTPTMRRGECDMKIAPFK